VQPISDPVDLVEQSIQPVVEEICIPIEGHRRRRMSKHALHRFHVAAGVHRDRRGGVPQVNGEGRMSQRETRR